MQPVQKRRRNKLRVGHKRRGIVPSKESLALQSWSIYITNTTEAQIRTQHIHQTYALRWKIEQILDAGRLYKLNSLGTRYRRDVRNIYQHDVLIPIMCPRTILSRQRTLMV